MKFFGLKYFLIRLILDGNEGINWKICHIMNVKVLWKVKKVLDNGKNRVYIISSQTKRVLILKQYRTKANINNICTI